MAIDSNNKLERLVNGIKQISNSLNLIELDLYEEYEKGNYDKLPNIPVGIPYQIVCLIEKEYNKLKEN